MIEEYRDGLGGLSQVGQRNVTNYETLSIQLQLNKLMELSSQLTRPMTRLLLMS